MSDRIKLLPCPFCEGPPCPIVQNGMHPYGAAERKDDYGDDGLWVKAFVFCHECGAEGPAHEMTAHFSECYDEAESEAVRLWQERSNKHRDLYDGGEGERLNEYPRPDDPRYTLTDIGRAYRAVMQQGAKLNGEVKAGGEGMSAMVRWIRAPRKRAKVGDKRVVSRALLLPTEIRGEVRWLGIERIEQEAYIGWFYPPEMRPYKGLKWRDTAWVDA